MNLSYKVFISNNDSRRSLIGSTCGWEYRLNISVLIMFRKSGLHSKELKQSRKEFCCDYSKEHWPSIKVYTIFGKVS